MSPALTMERIDELVGNMELQRNVHISLRHRYAYVGIPKAANSTIKWLLQEEELQGTKFTVKSIHERLESPLIAPFQLPPDQFLQILGGNGYTLFTCVRNPYTRLLSCFLDRVSAGPSVPRRQIAATLGREVTEEITFADFITALAEIPPREMNEHYRPQTMLTLLDLIEYDHVVPFERLRDQLPGILAGLFGKDPGDFPVDENKSPKSTSAADQMTEYYDESIATAVADLFAEDFERLGYRTEFEAAL